MWDQKYFTLKAETLQVSVGLKARYFEKKRETLQITVGPKALYSESSNMTDQCGTKRISL